MSGYIFCAHKLCFAVIIGTQGDLCADCKEYDEGHDYQECEGCDNDSDLTLTKGSKANIQTHCTLCLREFDDPRGCSHDGPRAVDHYH